MKGYRVSEKCIGCKVCVLVASENFDLNDNNIAYLKKQPQTTDEEAECNQAMEVCPVEAISTKEIIDDNLPDTDLVLKDEFARKYHKS